MNTIRLIVRMGFVDYIFQGFSAKSYHSLIYHIALVAVTSILQIKKKMVSRSLFFSDDLSPSPLHQKGDDDVADVFFGSPCRWVDEGSRDSGYSSPNNQVSNK